MMENYSYTFRDYCSLGRAKLCSEEFEALGCTWQIEFISNEHQMQLIKIRHEGNRTKVKVTIKGEEIYRGVKQLHEKSRVLTFNNNSVNILENNRTYYQLSDCMFVEVKLEECNTDSTLVSDMDTLWRDANDTHDFEIIVNQSVIPVHKLLLMRSPVLKAMLKANMQESSTNSLIINDFKLKTVKTFVYFLYHDNLHKPDTDELIELLQMSMLYQVKGLQKECEVRIAKQLKCTNCLDRLLFAHTYCCTALKESVFKFIVCHRRELAKVLTEELFDSLGSKLSYELMQHLMK